MHGVTSTGNNAKNRSTSGEGSSTGTTQGQTQGGRSVQQQTSVQPTLQSLCSAMAATSITTTATPGTSRQPTLQSLCSAMAATSITTTATPGTSRQVTGGDATESVRPRKRKRQCVQKFLSELRYPAARDTFIGAEEWLMAAKATPGTSRQVTGGDATESVRPRKRQCVQKPLPELRYSAARDTFIRAEKWLMRAKAAKKPEGSEAGKSHRPEAADARTSELSSVFEHKVSESFKELAIQQDASGENGEKNTLPLCRVIIGRMIEYIDEMDNEDIVAIRESLRKLEANSNIWAQHDALPLCQAVVEEILILEKKLYCDVVTYARRVMMPVYMLALSGVLAELEQRPADQWSLQSLRTLLDVSLCLDFGYKTGTGTDARILLLDNVTMLEKLCHRPVACGVLRHEKNKFDEYIAQYAARISLEATNFKSRLGLGGKEGSTLRGTELYSIVCYLKDMSDLIKIGGFFDPSGAVRS